MISTFERLRFLSTRSFVLERTLSREDQLDDCESSLPELELPLKYSSSESLESFDPPDSEMPPSALERSNAVVVSTSK